MKAADRVKTLVLLLGDVVALYLSLVLALVLRYGGEFSSRLLSQHLRPFTLVFLAWLLVFYVAGLYDTRKLRRNFDFLKVLLGALFVNIWLAVGFFYLFPSEGISPKTNLFIFIVVFGLIEILWRNYFNRLSLRLGPMANLVLMGESPAVEEIETFLKENPQLGYEIKDWVKDDESPLPLKNLSDWESMIRDHRIDLLVVPKHFKKQSRLAKIFFALLNQNVSVVDIPDFYETVFRKVPLAEIDEEWFLEHVTKHHKLYEDAKHIVELVAALFIEIILIPFEIVIAVLIKLTSQGSVIYKQVRIGQYGRQFILYKFRTMRQDAEKNGPQWASTNDKRSTPVGKFLRLSHLDELPQLLNIIKGDLSFVGPRPERPEFVAQLKDKIPYYFVRTIAKPGVTGWAQINHHKDLTVEDVSKKLEYDIYYLRNRSFVMDIAIVLKTFKMFVFTPQTPEQEVSKERQTIN